MKDNFDIHEWRLKLQLKEFVATLKQTPSPPTREEMKDLWNKLSEHEEEKGNIISSAIGDKKDIEELWSDLSAHNEERANLISSATGGRAGNIGKTESWETLDPEVRGSIIGYFIANPKEFREYQGIVSNINLRPRSSTDNIDFTLN